MVFRDDSEDSGWRAADASALNETAYRALYGMILTSRLKGPVFETRLSDRISVPRPVVRSALLILERQGLVFRGDNRAFVTRQVDLREFLDGMAVRGVLEGEAAWRATGNIPPSQIAGVRWATETLWTSTANHHLLWRLDDEMHGLVAEHCGNPVMAETITRLRTTARLCMHASYDTRRAPSRLEASRAEHLLILDALAKRDAKRARKLMTAHVHSLVRYEMSL